MRLQSICLLLFVPVVSFAAASLELPPVGPIMPKVLKSEHVRLLKEKSEELQAVEKKLLTTKERLKEAEAKAADASNQKDSIEKQLAECKRERQGIEKKLADERSRREKAVNQETVLQKKQKELEKKLANCQAAKPVADEHKPVIPAKTFVDDITGMEFVWVKGGCFQMGDIFGDGSDNEKPVHEVCVDDFYIGKYEVTQGEWRTIMGDNSSSFKKGDDYPVENVSWNDAQAFIKKLYSKTGKKYRLPTEAEWEFAARSGGKRERYSGGENVDDLAWYDKNSEGSTHPVGRKQKNGLGLYDMSGNVLEWCSDWYSDDYYSRSPRDNPQGPSTGSDRVLRGGSWDRLGGYVRSACRLNLGPDFRSSFIGLRLSPGH